MNQDCRSKGLPSKERPWLHYIEAGNMEAEPPKTTIYRQLRKIAEPIMDEAALIYMGNEINFTEFFKHVHDVANSLKSIGVKPGEIVPIFSSNTPETIYALYALNYIGAIPDFEYATISENGAIQAIKGCNARFVMVLDQLLPGIAGICDQDSVRAIITLPVSESLPIIKKALFKLKTGKAKRFPKLMSYKSFIKAGLGIVADEAPYQPDSTAVIVHSGGTTGKPKGVQLSNENLLYMYWAIQHNLDYVSDHDRCMAFIPMFHAFGLCVGLVGPLTSGVTVILSPLFDEPQLHKTFIRYRPEHIIIGASHVSNWMHNPTIRQMNLSSLSTICYGGSALTPAQERELDAFLRSKGSLARPMCGYGMSETSGAAIAERNSYYGKVGSTGVPFPAVNVKFLDPDTGEELGYNSVGELCMSTPGLMLGYFNDDEETAKALFTDEDGTRWVHSGDLGYIDEDGFVFITGRIKRIFSTRSGPGGTMFKLFPDYITSIIAEVDGVENCAVTCIKNPDYVNIAVGFVVLREGSDRETTEAAIWKRLKEEFPSHCLPKAIDFVEIIPLTKVGKPDWDILERKAEEIVR